MAALPADARTQYVVEGERDSWMRAANAGQPGARARYDELQAELDALTAPVAPPAKKAKVSKPRKTAAKKAPAAAKK